MIDIKVDDKSVISMLDRLAATAQNLSPVMSMIAQELERQTEKNFAAEGRPKWLGLSRATLENRVMARTKNQDGQLKKGMVRNDGRISKSISGRVGGMILQDTGQLAASISTSHNRSSATIGSNKVYAAIHQFGGKTGRGHNTTIAARPFLPINAQGQLQSEASENILRLVNDYLRVIIG